MLRRGRFEQRAEDRDFNVVGDQALEDLSRVRFVLDQRVMDLAAVALLLCDRELFVDGCLLQRQQHFAADLLRQR